MKSRSDHYNSIIIGAGQSGNPLARALATAGMKTALIEREHVGGTCVNEGCTPTKTMVASARVAWLSRRATDYGVNTGKIEVNMKTVRRRKQDIVESFRSGSAARIKKTEDLTLFMGSATFNGEKRLAVSLNNGNSKELTADRIFINTGARPAVLPISGLETVPFLNSTTIMELDTVPEHLIIIGGGYVGLEFGQMFRRFGSKVTILQKSGQLLRREDTDIAEEVTKILQDEGVDIWFESLTLKAENSIDGKIKLQVKTPRGEKKLTGSHLLLAAGRTPNTDDLNLEAAGVNIDKKGYIRVNEKLETSAPDIYAMGDVKGGPAFTHISYDDFRVLRQNLLEEGNSSIAERQIPYTVFIDPQLGRIGLSEKEAEKKGIYFKTASMPMSHVARALEVDESRGVMKVLIDAQNDQILGAAILGIEGGEIMSMLQIAMLADLPYTSLRDGIFAHPTLAESLNNLFATVT